MEVESRELTDAELDAVVGGMGLGERVKIRVRLWLWERTRAPVAK